MELLKGKPFQIIILLSIFAGIVLRFVFPEDMEWKFDELWMYNESGSILKGLPLPWIGMPSGGGFVNAGFSIWPFVLFHALSSDPVIINLFVIALNVLAILLFAIAFRNTHPELKLDYYGGLAIASLNVLCIVYSRKLWAQDLLPFFLALLYITYRNRSALVGAVLWGLLSALIGQLHISGYYIGLSIFLAALITDTSLRKKWTPWFILGFAAGMILAIPWFIEVLTHPSHSISSFSNIGKFEFFIRLLTDVPGINVYYSLEQETRYFLSGVWMVGTANYIPLVFVSIIIVTIIYALLRGFALKRYRLREINKNPELLFIVLGYLVFPAVFITISGIPVRSHYLIVCFPFIHILLARLIRLSIPKGLPFLLISQLVISVCFLFFIHKNEGSKGDYGKTYQSQVKDSIKKDR